jgi:hypothetical protein
LISLRLANKLNSHQIISGRRRSAVVTGIIKNGACSHLQREDELAEKADDCTPHAKTSALKLAAATDAANYVFCVYSLGAHG